MKDQLGVVKRYIDDKKVGITFNQLIDADGESIIAEVYYIGGSLVAQVNATGFSTSGGLKDERKEVICDFSSIPIGEGYSLKFRTTESGVVAFAGLVIFAQDAFSLTNLSGETAPGSVPVDLYQPKSDKLSNFVALSTNGIVVQVGAETFAGRSITGTTNQISVSNGSGVSGNPTISIASNPIIPGTSAITIPLGTSAQEPTASNGMIRYNSTTAKIRGVEGGVWKDMITGATGAIIGENEIAYGNDEGDIISSSALLYSGGDLIVGGNTVLTDNLIGSQIQGFYNNLDSIGQLSNADGFLYNDGSGNFSYESLGTMSIQDANSVAITGGSISGITDLAISDGGTGASTASAARNNLGLAIGSDVQSYSGILDDISDLTNSVGHLLNDGSGNLSWENVASYSVTNEADNRVITSTGAGTGNAEENMQFDGTTLNVTGEIQVDNIIIDDDNITSTTSSSIIEIGDNLLRIDGQGEPDFELRLRSSSNGSSSFAPQISLFSNGYTDNTSFRRHVQIKAGEGSGTGISIISFYNGSPLIETARFNGQNELDMNSHNIIEIGNLDTDTLSVSGLSSLGNASFSGDITFSGLMKGTATKTIYGTDVDAGDGSGNYDKYAVLTSSNNDSSAIGAYIKVDGNDVGGTGSGGDISIVAGVSEIVSIDGNLSVNKEVTIGADDLGTGYGETSTKLYIADGDDSGIDIVSTDAGFYGSYISFSQVDGTTFENKWSIFRQTNGDGSGNGSLGFHYGTNNLGTNNSRVLSISTTGIIASSGVRDNTTASAANVYIAPTTGEMFRSTSSLRYKDVLGNYNPDMEQFMKIDPIIYTGKNDPYKTKQIGWAAEQLDELGFKELVDYVDDKPDAIHYGNSVALLSAIIQKQELRLRELESKI